MTELKIVYGTREFILKDQADIDAVMAVVMGQPVARANGQAKKTYTRIKGTKRPYTQAEKDLAFDLRAKGKTWAYIGRQLHRTPGGVANMFYNSQNGKANATAKSVVEPGGAGGTARLGGSFPTGQ